MQKSIPISLIRSRIRLSKVPRLHPAACGDDFSRVAFNESRLDATGPLARDVGPLAYLGLHHAGKLLGAASERLDSKLREACLDLGTGEDRVHLAVQQLH